MYVLGNLAQIAVDATLIYYHLIKLIGAFRFTLINVLQGTLTGYKKVQVNTDGSFSPISRPRH